MDKLKDRDKDYKNNPKLIKGIYQHYQYQPNNKLSSKAIKNIFLLQIKKLKFFIL